MAWPGTPNAELTTTDAIDKTSYYQFEVVDTHKPQTIKFFMVSKESRGVTLLPSTEIVMDITCGLTSTTVLAPPILPTTVSDYLLMRGTNINYILQTAFTNSNEANCPVTSFGIVVISGGTGPADWTSTDGVDLVTLFTSVPVDANTRLTIPLIQENFRYFNFRL